MVSVSQFAAENVAPVVLILLVALFSVNAILCVFFHVVRWFTVQYEAITGQNEGVFSLQMKILS
jgi:hypothetical protein